MKTWDDVSKDISSIPDDKKKYISLLAEMVSVRERKGLTQAQISEITGLSQPSVARLENPSNNMSLITAIKYLEALGMELRFIPKETKEKE
ncbi:helix-turn-helix transcriptional regulator [Alkalihalophilus pseudofirmus]|uniref:helix-turn-helix domain-containing protein n=1 Tax=Alkalihalophilus pseudofirmus TaxID=79885 RepID=UPI00259B6D1D|nr:helix-turn-helix transcriptional regulator [Alkalihalophilus pseudofirmus]WEG18570.1 helix-turn-helix transcriptional regulator [Alkalihalophilus pseudofirmus]